MNRREALAALMSVPAIGQPSEVGRMRRRKTISCPRCKSEVSINGDSAHAVSVVPWERSLTNVVEIHAQVNDVVMATTVECSVISRGYKDETFLDVTWFGEGECPFVVTKKP